MDTTYRGSCFFAAEKLIWGGDFTFEDYGREGEGLVSNLTCSHCGAYWEGYLGEEEPEELDEL